MRIVSEWLWTSFVITKRLSQIVSTVNNLNCFRTPEIHASHNYWSSVATCIKSLFSVCEHPKVAYKNGRFSLLIATWHSGRNHSRISRTPYPPIGGEHVVTGGPKFQSRHHLSPQRKLRSPKLKYEALEISEVRGPFERKVHCSYCGPLWRQGIFTLQLLLGAPLKAK